MKYLAILFILIAFVMGAAAAQSSNTWRVEFYNNSTLSGSPVFTFDTAFINFNWGDLPPAPGVPADYFTARMRTSAFFYAGLYRFTVTADDEVALYINGVAYLNTFGNPQPGKTLSVDVQLLQGFSTVQVDFRELAGLAYITVNWSYLKPDPYSPYVPPIVGTPIPTGPTSATSVQTQYGNYTPCIRDNLHQANCFQSDGRWDSPNLGSIQMEPKIVLWGNCTPNQQLTQVLRPGQPAQRSQCSKTGAGWFPS